MKRNQTQGYMMVLIAGILWGSAGLFSTILTSFGFTAPMVAFIRISLGTLFMGTFMMIKYGPSIFRIDAKGIVWCLLLGVFAEGLYNISYAEAVSKAGMAAAAVMLYTSPVFVCIMARMFFKEKITQIKVAALVLNVAGCALAVTGGDLGDIHIPVVGFIAGIGAGFLYSLLPVINTQTLDKYNILTVNFYGLLFGAVLLTVIARPWEAVPQLMNAKVMLTAAGYGLIPTFAAYLIYLRGLSNHLEASRVPVMCSLETVSSAFIGLAALGEGISAGKAAGIAIVLVSIALMNMNMNKPLPHIRFSRRVARRNA